MTSRAAKKVPLWHTWMPKSFFLLKTYSLSLFKKDLLAGITVGLVALPLAMAFAIASGVPPERGLYTAIVAGFLISFLGGSRVQIGGPTGAFVVIVYDIVQRQGYDGLVWATLLAGGMLIVMSLCRLGTLIKYIPYPLITGFTTGIATLIFSSQIKDLLGLVIPKTSGDFLSLWGAYFTNWASFDPVTVAVGLGTLGVILLIRRFIPVVPWGIASIVLMTVLSSSFGLSVETIGSRFGEIPRSLPLPGLPHFPGGVQGLRALFPDALTIALLAGIESLLCALVADGMIGGRHKSDCELLGQGIANISSVFFGGIPATGAIARTATNIKAGAKTPVAGMIHAATLFLIMWFLAPIVSYIPLASLSAVLVMVAWNMSELEHFRHLFKAPAGDVLILLTAFLLTVLIDLTVAVEVGMILAAFLFMKRTSALSRVMPVSKLLQEKKDHLEEKWEATIPKELPKGVELYEIQGPLFFGVTDRLKQVLHDVEFPPRIMILRMRHAPGIDATGMHALKELYLQCKKEKIELYLTELHEQVTKSLKQYGLLQQIGKNHLYSRLDQALEGARKSLERADHAG